MANFALFVLTCRLKIRFLRRASMIPSCNSKLAILSRKTQRTLQCARVRFLHTNNKSPLLPYRDEPLLALAVLHPRKLVVYRVSRLLIATPRPCLFPPSRLWWHFFLGMTCFYVFQSSLASRYWIISQVEAKGGVGTNASYHELVRAYEHKLGVRGLHFTVRACVRA